MLLTDSAVVGVLFISQEGSFHFLGTSVTDVVRDVMGSGSCGRENQSRKLLQHVSIGGPDMRFAVLTGLGVSPDALVFLEVSFGCSLGPSCNDCRSPPFWGQAENTQSELRLLQHPAICCFLLCCSHSATLKDSSSVSSYSLTALGLFSLPQVQVPFMLSLNWPVTLGFIGLKAGWWCRYRNDES